MGKKKSTQSILKLSHDDIKEKKSSNIVLGVAMIVKNEEARILFTLESVKYCDVFIISDTGSTDKTKEKITEFCESNNIVLYMTDKYVSPFPKFHYDHARNFLLDYADDKADFLLLLDCNDELKNYENLRKFVNEYKGPEQVFHICQEWWNGISIDKYYNLRLVRTKFNWRYNDWIHEYLTSPIADKMSRDNEIYNKLKKEGKNPPVPDQTPIVGRVNMFTIYQDRTKDDDKSLKRFPRDRDILYEQHLSDPENSRCLFYLAQTYSCLGDNENSYKYYKKRLHFEGFFEEKYHAFFRCGETSKVLGHPWEETFLWYMKAYEYSCQTFQRPRAEPLFRIAEHYRDSGEWQMSFMYLRRCCELPYPEDAVLFWDKRIYEYRRWWLMGIVCYYAKENKEIGKMACLNAIKSENQQIDKDNLKFYNEDISIQEKVESPELTAKERLNKKKKEMEEKRKGIN